MEATNVALVGREQKPDSVEVESEAALGDSAAGPLPAGDVAKLDASARLEAAIAEIKAIVNETLLEAEARAAHARWQIGSLLHQMKPQIPHGQFSAWLETDVLPIVHSSRATVTRWMTAGKKPNFEDFHGDSSALYLLTGKAVPAKAAEEALRLSRAGGYVTHGHAKELIGDYTDS